MKNDVFNESMKMRYSLILILFLLASCVESKFKLADDSVLPEWFSKDVLSDENKFDVTLAYYTNGKVRFDLIDVQVGEGKTVSTVWGKVVNGENAAIHGDSYYPHREKILINGVLYIVVHKEMEPIFYLPD